MLFLTLTLIIGSSIHLASAGGSVRTSILYGPRENLVVFLSRNSNTHYSCLFFFRKPTKRRSLSSGSVRESMMQKVPELTELLSNDYGSLVSKKLEQAINPDEYMCEDQTLIGAYVDSLFDEISDEDLGMFDHIYYDLAPDIWVFAAILFWGADSPVMYPSKQQGRVYSKAMQGLKAFWDSYPEDITLNALSMNLLLTEEPMMLETIMFFFGVDGVGAQAMYDEAVHLLETHPPIGFYFPLYTLNAFAFDNSDIPPEFWPFPNTGAGIAMGDGIVSFLDDIGFREGGPEYVLFHEFGHQVQYRNRVFDDPPFDNDPENTRRYELMADALAAYYGHHPKGATFQNKRVEAMSMSAFAVGDCYYESPGHHGTPNQRAKAVKFATDLVDSKPNGGKGKILTSGEFIMLFDAAYDGIVAPDV